MCHILTTMCKAEDARWHIHTTMSEAKDARCHIFSPLYLKLRMSGVLFPPLCLLKQRMLCVIFSLLCLKLRMSGIIFLPLCLRMSDVILSSVSMKLKMSLCTSLYV